MFVIVTSLVLALVAPVPEQTMHPDSVTTVTAGRMTLRVHTDEASDALAVITAADDGSAQAPWAHLQTTEAYHRLHAREASMGRAFTDSSFFAFLRSPGARHQAVSLRRVLNEWRAARIDGAVAHAEAYLPAGGPVKASLYFMVKPYPNTFVYETDRDPAIFVAIDTAVTGPEFANEVAHELHHIGIAAACAAAPVMDRPEPLKTVVNWMSAFGEGWAMLAAAGGPDVHPHATSDSATRARWDRDYADTPAQMRELETFFTNVLDRRTVVRDSIVAAGMSFFGVQGAWYTVGYLMARTIEKTDGHARLMSVLCDPIALVTEYQRAALGQNQRGATFPLWTPAFVQRLTPK